LVGAVELKWWRQDDAANASNRRRDLLKDFVRAAALYAQVESFSLVALISTAGSWSATVPTSGSDRQVMTRLAATGVQKWNLRKDADSAGVRGALRMLKGKCPVPNVFHTEVLAEARLQELEVQAACATVWAVRKPQGTRTLSEAEVWDLASGS
jgi:hypothetical protein